jgi:DNA-binding SARP family transcriptional activator
MSIPKLLLQAQSKVIPDVFSHPLWINFVRTNQTPSPEVIQDLRISARRYETQGDILSSAEILFLCASLQRQLKNFEDAVNSLQHSRYLAENHDLHQLGIFAAWGIAALHYQQGDLQSTFQALSQLQKLLNRKNEWILFNLIELVKQTLRSPEQDAGPLAFALDWLKSWGKQTTVGRKPLQPSEHGLRAWKSKLVKRATHFLKKMIAIKEPTPLNVLDQQMAHRDESNLHQEDFHSQGTFTATEKNHQDLRVISAEHPSSATGHQEKPRWRADAPTLMVYCLGPFRVYQDEELITEWPSGIGKSIFKYLVTHRVRPVSKEFLMDLFWSDADPESARNNLNVAIYGLRKALRAVRADFSHVLYQEDHYLINPDMAVWVDVEDFSHHLEVGQAFDKAGQTSEAVTEYEAAEGLYAGDFLVEDLYEEWTIVKRRNLKESYLSLLDRLSRYYLRDKQYANCVHVCQKILVEDDCREDAHRRLMRCYFSQDQPYLAIRQYHLCRETLKNELDILPTSNTRDLYELIRGHNRR